MTNDHCDARPRLYVTGNRDGKSVTWTRHPAARGQFAGSIDMAVQQAELRDGDVVILWSPKPPP